jgi:hypothetical protein
MKTLIIHPEDPTTTFLNPIYADIPNKTLVQSNSSKTEILSLMEEHDRIMMMGHGCPGGLLAVGKFEFEVRDLWSPWHCVVDREAVGLLSTKIDSIFIWCHADVFLEYHPGPRGFYTGMFISEVREAEEYGVHGVSQEEVDESNQLFSQEVAKAIHLPADELCRQVKKGYGQLAAAGNPIAVYNYERLYFR